MSPYTASSYHLSSPSCHPPPYSAVAHIRPRLVLPFLPSHCNDYVFSCLGPCLSDPFFIPVVAFVSWLRLNMDSTLESWGPDTAGEGGLGARSLLSLMSVKDIMRTDQYMYLIYYAMETNDVR
ncbi:hypothetical protein GT037_003434 [Alternaria burnsii]|uniref:Uncharacterized protein n=1 Tax=Alternaria burnsii TaxID=1187904 RepID=A0A8H7EGR6_9PLEO|nr:uncharacterized protein GT037_003434 [Alternaria burnsii]KAF7678053.1 hypothetical protein GT037_003434 [Alternaria burnsii]